MDAITFPLADLEDDTDVATHTRNLSSYLSLTREPLLIHSLPAGGGRREAACLSGPASQSVRRVAFDVVRTSSCLGCRPFVPGGGVHRLFHPQLAKRRILYNFIIYVFTYMEKFL